MRMAAGGEQANLGVRPCPEPQAREKAPILADWFRRRFVKFSPIESNGLICKAPRADHLESHWQQRVSSPQQQYTIISRPVGHRQCLDLGQRHAIVMGL